MIPAVKRYFSAYAAQSGAQDFQVPEFYSGATDWHGCFTERFSLWRL